MAPCCNPTTPGRIDNSFLSADRAIPSFNYSQHATQPGQYWLKSPVTKPRLNAADMNDPEILEIYGRLLLFRETTDMSELFIEDTILVKQNDICMLAHRLDLKYEYCVESGQARIFRSRRTGCADVDMSSTPEDEIGKLYGMPKSYDCGTSNDIPHRYIGNVAPVQNQIIAEGSTYASVEQFTSIADVPPDLLALLTEGVTKQGEIDEDFYNLTFMRLLMVVISYGEI
jgi:hypothetical protein